MKSKQVIETEAKDVYFSWSDELQFTDVDENEIAIKLDHDLVLKLEEKLIDKATRIREIRIEAAKAQLESENETADTNS